MLLQFTFKDALTIYAVVLSSIVFGWNLLRDLRDRAKLKVSVRLRRLVKSTDGKMYGVSPGLPVEAASVETYVVITALNVGRRPVKVTGWGGGFIHPQNGKRHFHVIPAGMPKMLPEWESIDELTDELHSSIDNIKYLAIVDAAGREWKAPRSQLNKVKKDLQSLSLGTSITGNRPSDEGAGDNQSPQN